MFLKRQVPLIIVIVVGLITLFGHFINHLGIQNFVNNDSTQWYDIIASFAIFLGALNLLKLQLLKIFKKQKNWPYSILAVLGFFFAITAGFFYKGANVVTLYNPDDTQYEQIIEVLSPETDERADLITAGLEGNPDQYDIQKIYLTKGGAQELANKVAAFGDSAVVGEIVWGAHLQAKRGNSGSLFYWLFQNIFTPLSATMFALLAFFVASASYRAFRIRNFEATLLLGAGIILMLGRVPVGQLIPAWFIAVLVSLGIGALAAPILRDRRYVFGLVAGLLILVLVLQLVFPAALGVFFLPTLQEWIFNVPTAAGARAIMIGIGLGIVGTSFRIIIGLERSFLGEN